MKAQTIFKSTFMLLATAILVATLAFNVVVSAQEAQDSSSPAVTETEMTTEESPKEDEKSEDTDKKESSPYTYIAQSGDSYTKMARKAVQTYGINTETNLSGAQIVFVETNLTNLAGSPELNLGQKVSINENDVKDWVVKAQQLTESQTEAWAVYASRVDFNTNAVGQAS